MKDDSGKSYGLSKSRYVSGLQCKKRLYLDVHLKKLASKVSASQQLRFDEGSEVGAFARTFYKDGVLVGADHTQGELALIKTKELIESGVNTLFEAAFAHEGVLVRVDILTRNSKSDSWHIIEVKSSTAVKAEHLEDVSIQCWTMKRGIDPIP